MILRLDENTLSQSFKKEGVMRLYIVIGQDAYLVDAAAAAVMKAAGPDAERIRFDAEKTPAEEMEELFYTYSMLPQPRIAIFEDVPQKLADDRVQLLASLFADIPEDVTVVLKQICTDRYLSVSKKMETLAAACTRSAVVSIGTQTAGRQTGYVENMAKREGAAITKKAADMVLALCGGDLMTAHNEVKKLAALSDYGEIQPEHVQALCVRTVEAGVYDMIGAIERNDVKKAMRCLGEMLDARTEPLSICGALNTSFINLWRARLVRDKGLNESAMFELFDYRKGDKKVSIACSRCQRYSRGQLQDILAILYELDRQLKSSAVDNRILMEQGLIRLATKVAAG